MYAKYGYSCACLVLKVKITKCSMQLCGKHKKTVSPLLNVKKKLKKLKGMDNNCHISDFEQACSYVENWELILVFYLAKHPTCMTID